MFKYILFDLDGTLTDPKEGICKSVQYALKRCGIDEPDIDKLEPFIGPPLKESFMSFYGFNSEQTEAAVKYYRERFSEVGLYENKIYPGVGRLLSHLKKENVKVAIASSKPTVFVEKILKHFKIYDYFDVVIGSELDGRRSDKTEVVNEALLSLYYGNDHETRGISEFQGDEAEKKKNTAMVGDRHFDITGAKNAGVKAVGVSYGYGGKAELRKAGADYIAKSVEQLTEYLLDMKAGKSKTETKVKPAKPVPFRSNKIPENSFMRAIYVLTPFALYYLSMMAVMLILLNIYNDHILAGKPINEAVFGVNGEFISGYINGVAMFVGGLVILLMYFTTDRLPVSFKAGNTKTITMLAVPTGIFCAFGLNLLFGYICTWFPAFNKYLEEGSYNSTIPVSVGIVIYIIISPIVEELIFRYLIFGRSEKILGTGMAMFASSLFFGFYHGNIVQGIYAFIMGYIMVYVYKKADNIFTTMLLHAVANAAVYLSPFLPAGAQKAITSFFACMIFIVLGTLSVLFISFTDKDGRITGKTEISQ